MLPRSVSILISFLSLLLLSHDVTAHLLRRQQVDVANPISTHSVIQTTSTSELSFSETPTVTASDFSFLPTTTTPHATITSAPFNLTNSTIGPGRNSTATHNSTATSTATTAPSPALPIEVRLTPAFGIAGALLIISGGVLAFWNSNSIQAFLGGAMLAALATIVLIVYVMNPPISKGLQCAYLVAGLVTGLALGGMSLLFREIIESLTCLLGGFCIGMWFLCLGDDGLIHVTAGRVALIAGCSFVAWSIYWIPFTRDWTLMALTSFAGATVVILGVDCYTRAGLKELWVYLWDIHADLFEYHMTFNITKGIRAELAAIIVLWGAGIVAQAHLWRKIYSRKNAKRAEEKAARADVEALNEAAGRAMQTQLAHEKANWERTYADSIHEVDGDDKSKSRRSSEDSGVHGIATLDYSQSRRYSNHRHGGFSASESGVSQNGIPQRHISTSTNDPRYNNLYPGSQPLSTPRRSTNRVSSYSSTHAKSVPISPVASQPQISPGRSSFHPSVNSPTKSHHEILIEEPEYLAQDNASQESGSNRDESLSLVATVDDAQSRRSLVTNQGSSSSNKTESHQDSQNDASHIESLVSDHNSCKSTSNREDEKECASSQTSAVSSAEKVALPGKISQAALKSRTNDWVRQSIGADHPDLENIKPKADSNASVTEESARPVNVEDLQLAAGDVSIPTTGVSQTLADFYGPSIAVANARHEKRRTSRKSAGQESHKHRSSGRRASAGNNQTLLDRRDGYLKNKHQLAQMPQSALSLRASDSRIISRRQSARNAMDGNTGQLQRQNLTMSNLIIPSNNQNPNNHRRSVLSPKQRESQLASFRESVQADPGVRLSPTPSPGLKPSSSLAHMGSHLCYRPEDEQILERQRSLLLNKMEADRTTRENEQRNRELADQRLEQMMNFGGMQSTHREMLRRMQDKAH